jgi:hypothetical protein
VCAAVAVTVAVNGIDDSSAIDLTATATHVVVPDNDRHEFHELRHLGIRLRDAFG